MVYVSVNGPVSGQPLASVTLMVQSPGSFISIKSSSVEVKPFYYASISQGRGETDSDFFDRKAKAFKWLRDNGLGDIIKNDITVTFGRDEDNKALQYAELAKGQGFEPIQRETVHAVTLKALVRERLENNLEMPSDVFKIYSGNSTKIKRR